ncbi:metabolite traffic protein EboE [Wenyingzhuangia sp. IMCC45574]
MRIGTSGHLSYCTNIHAGESWEATFKNIQKYVLGVKQNIVPEEAFGIGLRLSNEASIELNQAEKIEEFKEWLLENNMYVFTMNGFPYGNFHQEEIKDQVHAPDWTTQDRKNYTIRLFDILAEVIPVNVTGGISTSPISYKFWHLTDEKLEETKNKACEYLINVVAHLIDIKKETGKSLHLDIEPEPDGVIEDTEEFIAYYNNYLIAKGVDILAQKNKITKKEAEQAIREHIQLCFDICHSAVEYENIAEVVTTVKAQNIQIGKIQLSAALKCQLNKNESIEVLKNNLKPFHEPSYLHQAVIKSKDGKLTKYADLDVAIDDITTDEFEEIRTHFHVPIFLAAYQNLQSTQDDLISSLQLWKENEYSEHLEIETYTWDVLPNQMQTNITDAVTREVNWVLEQIK